MGSDFLPNAKEIWFTGWSSFIRDRKRLAGYTGTSQTYVTETRSLPPGTPAQKAKLAVLARVLMFRAEKLLSFYTDSL